MSNLYRATFRLVCGLAILLAASVVTAQVAPGPPGEDGRPQNPGAFGRQPPKGKFAGMATEVGKSKSSSGFVDLLEEGDLSQFRGYKEEEVGSGWSIDGKYLHFDGTKSGDIVTVDTYEDFELQFDWKVSPGGNSGVMYRVGLGDGAPYLTGPEFQVLDDTKHKDGERQLTSAGAIYGLYAPTGDKKRKAGVWNKARIVVQGNKVTHYVNKKKVVEATIDSGDWRKRVSNSKFKAWEKFGTLKTGHIAFQDHGDEVWYRNIKIKRLSGEASSLAEKKKTRRASNSKLKDMMQSMDAGGPPSDGIGQRGRNQNDRKKEKASRKSSGNSKLQGMQMDRPGQKPEKDGKKKGSGAPSAPGGAPSAPGG